MENQFLLNPFFLDSPAPLLKRLAKPNWIVNHAVVEGNSQAVRIGTIHTPLVQRVRAAAASGHRPVAIGGDCLQPAAVLAGLRVAGLDPVIGALGRSRLNSGTRRGISQPSSSSEDLNCSKSAGSVSRVMVAVK